MLTFGVRTGLDLDLALFCSGMSFLPRAFHAWMSYGLMGAGSGKVWGCRFSPLNPLVCMMRLIKILKKHSVSQNLLRGVPLVVIWRLWRERCRRVYEDSSLSAYAVFLDICSTLRLQAYGVRPKDKEGMIGMEFLRALKLIFFPTGSLCDVVLSVWRTLLVSLVPAGFSGNICFFNAVVGVLMLLFCCLLSGCTVHVNCFAIAADCLFQLISVDVGISRFCSAAFLLCPSPLLTGIPAAFSYGVTAAFSDEFQLPLLSPFAAAFHASVHLITAGISAAVQLD
ncbi:unnamed protein product [Ilex paraguariensis]|uniref:Uncharacterized protein n=1 Tax=Ilex paraguariensis TaxID=185542 RepID=A0ABC8TEH4_9AQUA